MRVEPTHCSCCLSPATEIAIDDLTQLCLGCQPCPWCGRMGTACDWSRGESCCDPTDYPDRPRRDFNEYMTELAEGYRGERGL